MKSLQTIKEETGLTYEELCNAFRNCISYFLSDEELEPFLIKEIEIKLYFCTKTKNKMKFKETKHKKSKRGRI